MLENYDFSIPRKTLNNISLTKNSYNDEKYNNIQCLMILYKLIKKKTNYSARQAELDLASLINTGNKSTKLSFNEAMKFLIKIISILPGDEKNTKINGESSKTLQMIISFWENWADKKLCDKYINDYYIEEYNGNGDIKEIDVRKIAEQFQQCVKPGWIQKSTFKQLDEEIALALLNYKSSINDYYAEYEAQQL